MSDELLMLIQGMLIAMALGFLIGLEREYSKRVVENEEQFAGVRSYTFIALFGFLCAYLSQQYGDLVFVVGLSGLIALVIATYVMSAKAGNYGITTEISGILAFTIGALVLQGEVLFAVIITVAITSLLSLKLKLHAFIATLTPQDIRAFIQFVIISAVILPFLPDEQMGPNGVWNPHDIWLMVILVTGISLAGYLLAKIFGATKGTLLAGVVGGLVSSTAVTLTMARRSRTDTTGPHLILAASIIGATGVLYPRILLETWVIDQELGMRMLGPIIFITAVTFGIVYFIHSKGGEVNAVELPTKNPLNFGVSIQFAIVYMTILWLMDIVSKNQSAQGFYAASLVFGATDMDAITLSIARNAESIGVMKSVIAVLLATLSNTVMKFMIVVFFGDNSLRKWVGFGFGTIFIATVLAILAMRWL